MMDFVPFTVTLKNYRAFADSNPLTIKFRPNFTAYVGPNNSGKTSALRCIFELRPFWSLARDNRQLSNLVKSPADDSYFQSTTDDLEPFCHFNQRDLSIEVSLDDIPKNAAVDRIKVSFSRNRPKRPSIVIRGRDTSGQFTSLQSSHNRKAMKDEKGALYDYEPIAAVMEWLQRSIYIGAYRNTINIGAKDYFDVKVGTGFISLWDEWKSGDSRIKSAAINDITETIRNIFEFRQLTIYPNQQNDDLFADIDGQRFRLNEIGSGFSQFTMVLGNAAVQRPSFILIDEPELHLHPTLQREFLTSLAARAEHGVLFATHSIGLARSVAEHIYSFSKINGLSVIAPLEKTPTYAEFLGELSYSAYQELGVDKVLLVEGVTEVLVFQQLLRKLQKDTKVLSLPLGGSALIRPDVENLLLDYKRITPRLSAIVDSEKAAADTALTPDRTGFLSSCQNANIPCLVTARRATENYFTGRAIKAALGQQYEALGEFERLEDKNPKWPKSNNWRIARELNWPEIAETDLGRFLEGL